MGQWQWGRAGGIRGEEWEQEVGDDGDRSCAMMGSRIRRNRVVGPGAGAGRWEQETDQGDRSRSTGSRVGGSRTGGEELEQDQGDGSDVMGDQAPSMAAEGHLQGTLHRTVTGTPLLCALDPVWTHLTQFDPFPHNVCQAQGT